MNIAKKAKKKPKQAKHAKHEQIQKPLVGVLGCLHHSSATRKQWSNGTNSKRVHVGAWNWYHLTISFSCVFLLKLHVLCLRSSEGMMPREARHRIFVLILNFLYCSALAPLRLGGGCQSSATSNSLLISSFSIQNGARRRRVVRGGGGKGQGEGERSGGFGICSCF